MKVSLFAALATTILVSAPALAGAAEAGKSNLYWSINGQAAFLQDIEGSGTASGVPFNFKMDSDIGIGVGSAIGYQFQSVPVRVEGEVTYRYNTVSDITVTALGSSSTASADEGLDSLAFMANGYYDINFGSNIVPYVGLGLGAVDIDGSDTVFAYQGMAGVSYNLNERSNLYTGYRYFRADDTDFDANLNGGDYVVHSVEVGYRLGF